MEGCATLVPEKLAEVLETRKEGNVLLLDLRSFMNFNQCHLSSAINVCVPNSLLKRKNFSLEIVESTISNEDSREKFKQREGVDIILYDNDSEKMTKNCVISCLLQKLRDESRVNSVSFLSGGFESFSKMFPQYCLWKSEANCLSKQLNLIPQPHEGKSGEAIRILDYLYLGDEEGSRSRSLLEQHQITDILNTAKECPNYLEGFNYLRLELLDCGTQDMDIPMYQRAFSFIDTAREHGRKVFVHCRAGQSRSPTIVIAYLIRTYQWSLLNAYRFVQEKRPQTSPNLSFMGHLALFEEALLGVGKEEIEKGKSKEHLNLTTPPLPSQAMNLPTNFNRLDLRSGSFASSYSLPNSVCT